MRDSTVKIVEAIQDLWPDLPSPQEVAREDGELLGRAIPTSGGWQAVTTFNAPLGPVTTYDEAIELVHAQGLASRTEPWWIRRLEGDDWLPATLVEVRPDRGVV